MLPTKALSLNLPPPKERYDVDDQTQFRRQVEHAITTLGSRQTPDVPYFNVSDYGNRVGQGYDDTAALTTAIADAVGSGGGQLLIPSTLLIASDIACPRNVIPTGLGGNVSIIKSTDSTQRRFKMTGPTTSLGDALPIIGLMFDKVSLDFGSTSADVGRGSVVAWCEFINSDRAIYYGFTTFNTAIMGCRFRLNTTHVYYDFATAVAGSGASMVISDSIISEATNGLYVNGNTADGHHIYVTNSIFDNISRPVKVVNSGEGVISLKNVSFEAVGYGYSDGYFVENDGSNVFIDGFWALSATETAWVYNKSGNTFIRNGRGSWLQDKFAKITSGIIQVDPSTIFTGSRWWGSSSIPMTVAGSSGGKIVGPRTAYVGRQNVNLTTLTNAVPYTAANDLRIGEAYDGNNRVFEFDVECSVVGSDNTLRIQVANGSTTVVCDLVFPLVLGGAHVRVTLNRGSELAASALYAPTTAGSAAWVRQTTTDSSPIGATKFLQFTSIKAGATASTLTITNLCELISGPEAVGI